MKSLVAALSLVVAALASPEVRADAPATRSAAGSTHCYFAKNRRRAEITTSRGVRVELYDEVLTLDGNEISPCNGLPRSHPSAIARFADGFAVAFREGGVATFRDGAWKALPDVPNGPIRALAAQGDVLWLGTQSAGLVRWRDGKSSSVVGLGKGAITALYAEDEHALHVGTDPSGWWIVRDGAAPEPRRRRAIVGCFRERSDRDKTPEARVEVQARPHPDACRVGRERGSLPSAHVTALASRNGELVVGTFDAGAFIFSPAAAPRALVGAPRFVNAFARQGDALFIASPSGLYRAAPNAEAERVQLMAREPHVNGLFANETGTLWLATSDGLGAFSAKGLRWFDERNGLPARIVYAVTETTDGAVWAATSGGVARLSAEGVTRFSASSSGLSQDWVTALLADGTSVVAGTYSAGVVRLHARGGSERWRGLEAAWVNPGGLARAHGALFVATLGTGLLTATGAPAFEALPSRDVTAILAENGGVWVGTRAGLFRSERP
jgi:ligand-binding sensor domain-containing protein